MSGTAAGISVPRYSTWSETDLASMEERDFAEMLWRRATTIARDIYDAASYQLVELEPDLKAERLGFYLRRRAWAEWYFGTVTPARQISLLPETEISLKVRLARQIADEMRHHDVFSAEARRRGHESRVERFPPPAALHQMHDVQVSSGSPAELAAANQYSGEIVLLVQSNEDGNILRSLVDERIFAAIVDIEADEPAHVAIGADLVTHYSSTPQQRRTLAVAQEGFLRALISQHSAELALLGSRRERPLPTFE